MATFGYTSIGASGSTIAGVANAQLGVSDATLPSGGSISKLTAHFTIAGAGAAKKIKGAIWDNSRNLIAETSEVTPSGTGWVDLPFSSVFYLAAGIYRIGIIGESGDSSWTGTIARDVDVAVNRLFQTTGLTFPTIPNPVNDWSTTGKFSLYATYTTFTPQIIII